MKQVWWFNQSILSFIYISHAFLDYVLNKNVFQLDAYRPLQWPSGEGVCLGGGCLPGGIHPLLPTACWGTHHLPRWTESLTHTCETRIHSSRMRTACLLTVSQHALLGGVTCPGVYLLGGVPAQGGVPARGGGGGYLPPVNRMTDRCKILPCPKLRLRAVNITFQQLLLRAVIKQHLSLAATLLGDHLLSSAVSEKGSQQFQL